MSIRIKNRKIITTTNALSILFQRSFPTKGAWAIKRNYNIYQSVAKDIEDFRLTLLKQYCELDNLGQPKVENDKYLIREGQDLEEFNKKMNEFLDTETNIEPYKTSIDNFDGVEIESFLLDAIEDIIE